MDKMKELSATTLSNPIEMYRQGFLDGQESYKKLYDEAVKMAELQVPKYIVVTQEQFDKIKRQDNLV